MKFLCDCAGILLVMFFIGAAGFMAYITGKQFKDK